MKSCFCFYHLQGEPGESAGRPNAFRLRLAADAKPTLADVQAAFPLAATGSFHFRFRVNSGQGFAYLEVPAPDTPLPLLGGNVHAKVLRLGE